MLIRQHDQIEVFVGVDQGIREQQRQIRRHVLIECAVHEQQPTLEVLGEILVGFGRVVGGAVRTVLQETLELLAPVIGVAGLIVVCRTRRCRL